MSKPNQKPSKYRRRRNCLCFFVGLIVKISIALPIIQSTRWSHSRIGFSITYENGLRKNKHFRGAMNIGFWLSIKSILFKLSLIVFLLYFGEFHLTWKCAQMTYERVFIFPGIDNKHLAAENNLRMYVFTCLARHNSDVNSGLNFARGMLFFGRENKVLCEKFSKNIDWSKKNVKRQYFGFICFILLLLNSWLKRSLLIWNLFYSSKCTLSLCLIAVCELFL